MQLKKTNIRVAATTHQFAGFLRYLLCSSAEGALTTYPWGGGGVHKTGLFSQFWRLNAHDQGVGWCGFF